jgi:hypothetical protein
MMLNESHADLVCPPQCPAVVIFALRGIGEPIAMAAEEIVAGSVELRHPPPAGDPIHDTWADEIRPDTPESARHPDDLRRLFDIPPFFALAPDPIRQDQCVAVSSELDRGNPLAILLPFQAAAMTRF